MGSVRIVIIRFAPHIHKIHEFNNIAGKVPVPVNSCIKYSNVHATPGYSAAVDCIEIEFFSYSVHKGYTAAYNIYNLMYVEWCKK